MNTGNEHWSPKMRAKSRLNHKPGQDTCLKNDCINRVTVDGKPVSCITDSCVGFSAYKTVEEAISNISV